MSKNYTRELAKAALGNKKAELVIKNGQVVNVFTNEILETDIAITDGIIVGLGDYEGEQEIDATGKIICPGFIDAHLHLESTLVKPQELIYRASKRGTTTFIVDPHEVANVAGLQGMEYMLDQTAQVQANVFVMMSSCVPALDIEDNGARIAAKDMKSYVVNKRILGLGEVMDSASVLAGEEFMLDKLKLFHEKIIDGHAGYLDEKQVMCYKLAGIATDHECCDYEMAMREARAGVQILIREGTAAKNLEAIVSGIVEHKIPIEKFSFCTDDKHIAEIEKNGHIGFNIKKAINLGIQPIDAVKMATVNTARTYGLQELGAIAPGYQADIVIISDFESFEIERVFYKGKEIESQIKGKDIEIAESLLHTVNLGAVNLQSFELTRGERYMPIINIVEGQILTVKTVEEVPTIDGLVKANSIYNKVAVLERHKATGKRGIGIVKGYQIKKGAIASTFCHDSHNLIVVGDNDMDMLHAVKELENCGGGYTIVEDGVVVYTLELPVMGLISNKNYEFVSEKLSRMIQKAHEMGVPEGIDPFITLSFLALPVIPEIRVTARGIYDVIRNEFIGNDC